MKVLLLKPVKSLGQAGEIKEVSDGYFRNYLAPQGLATPATEGAVKRVSQQREVESRRSARVSVENRKLAERIRETPISFRVKVGEQHRLFGSVTAADIAEELEKKLGQPIDKRHVELEEPIRHLGTFEVPIHLAQGVDPKLTVVVEREEGSTE